MQEIIERATKPLDLKTASKRAEIQTLLDRGVEYAFAKFTNRFTKNSEKLMWGRLLAQCGKIQSEVLKDQELEDLLVRVERLEREAKKN